MTKIVTRSVRYGIAFLSIGVLCNCSSLDYDPLTTIVKDNQIIAEGVIDDTTPQVLGSAIDQNNQVRTLVLYNVPGSADDPSNLQIARKVRASGLATYIPANGMIASGGTDLFLAGVTRKIEKGACIGVHSWAGGSLFKTIEGSELPRDHPEHEKYLDYYKEMNVNPEFYWYTLNAASADNIHWMAESEIKKYNIGEIINGGTDDDMKSVSNCEMRFP